MRIVKVEETRRVMPELEAELGLPPSDYDELRRSPHHTTRSDQPGFFGDTCFRNNRNVAMPSSPAFYDADLVREVGRLYAEDIERYDYAAPVLSGAD